MQIPFEIFNAACIATSKNISRTTFYKTIVVTEDNRLVSTNGGLLYVSNELFGLTPGMFQFSEMPPKALLVEIKDDTIVGYDEDMKCVWELPVIPVKKDFPDWRNKAVWGECPQNDNIEIAWGLPILEKMVKMFGNDTLLKYYSGGYEHPSRVIGNHGTVWVMPCRMPGVAE